MSAAATSVDAYRAFRSSPSLSRQQRVIVDHLAAYRGGHTRAELAQATGIRLSSVCGRVNELLERGEIVERSRRPCSVTGVQAHVLRIAPNQSDLFA